MLLKLASYYYLFIDTKFVLNSLIGILDMIQRNVCLKISQIIIMIILIFGKYGCEFNTFLKNLSLLIFHICINLNLFLSFVVH